MIAVFWEELNGWLAKAGWRRFCLAVAFMALVGTLFGARPEPGVWFVLVVVTLSGSMLGRQAWGEVASARWLTEAHLTPGQVAAGKVLTAVCVALLFILILLPVLLVTIPIWGVETSYLVRLVWLAVLATATAADLSLLGASLDRWRWGYMGELCILIWLCLTGFVPFLRLCNPFAAVAYAVRPGCPFFPWKMLLPLGVWFLVHRIAVVSFRREMA